MPIVNTLAFLFTVIGDWWVDGKVISRSTLPPLSGPRCSTAELTDVQIPWPVWFCRWQVLHYVSRARIHRSFATFKHPISAGFSPFSHSFRFISVACICRIGLGTSMIDRSMALRFAQDSWCQSTSLPSMSRSPRTQDWHGYCASQVEEMTKLLSRRLRAPV